MKTKIATSIKQSKKLLELGLDAYTADMWYLPIYLIEQGYIKTEK